MRPSFLSVATKPKWLGALALALAAAAVCALLGQWQLSRTFRITNDQPTVDSIVQLTAITKHGENVTTDLADRHVAATVKLQTKKCFVISNRLQLLPDGTTKPGFWVVTDSIDTLGAHLFLAHGFADSQKAATNACGGIVAKDAPVGFQNIIGRYEPSEEPKRFNGEVFDSFSIPQLINIDQSKPIATFAGFVVMDSSGLDTQLESIKIGIKSSQAQVNLLNAFYAIEWVIFAGFAIFLWYRLIQDERDRAEEQNG